MSHTQGGFVFIDGVVYRPDGTSLTSLHTQNQAYFTDQEGRMVAAALNTCRDIPLEGLESGTVKRKVEAFDELLEAAEMFLPFSTEGMPHVGSEAWRDAKEELRRAIAKYERREP